MGLGFLSWLVRPDQKSSLKTAAKPAPGPDRASLHAGRADSALPAFETSSRAHFPAPGETAQLEADLRGSRAAQARLRQDLAELLKAHRQQAHLLERNQNVSRRLEDELARSRDHVISLESELASTRRLLGGQTARLQELEALAAKHESLQVAYETLDRDRAEVTARLAEVVRSRDNGVAERDRMSAQLSTVHATLVARDAQVAALTVAGEEWKARVAALDDAVANLNTGNAQLKTEIARAAELQAAHRRLELEFEALSARWDVAREQLAEAEQQLKTSQATIKAAQRLSSSVEWRSALDGVLDAASELVRFERGTLALVDELQEELKVEAARNSPIAISEMSRFKLGEGIAGWALSHRESLLVRDSRSDPRFKASDPTHQPRSFIAVPLLAGSEGLGVLTVARPANDPFTEQDLRSLSRVANDAAHALINARLVDLLKQREDHLSTLVQKARELWSAGDVNQVVRFVLTSAQELTQGKGALLALRSPKSSALEVLGSQGIPGEMLQQRITWGAPAAVDVMRTGKPWVSPMRDLLPPAMADTVEAAGLRTLISVSCGTVPRQLASVDATLLSRSDVESAEEVTGVLNVYRDSSDPVSAAQLEQLRAFADQAAVAIKHVRRWEGVKEQLQASAGMNTRLMGRERYINQLQFRIQQLEQELGRYKAA